MNFKRMKKIEDAVMSEIDKLSESEKMLLVGECQRMSITNCGWIMYGLKGFVIQVTKAQLRMLKIKKDLTSTKT